MLIEHRLQRLDFSTSSCSLSGDPLYVDYPIEALSLLRENPFPSGQMFNVGTASKYLTVEIAAAIVSIMGSGIRLLVGAPSRLSEVEQLYCSTHKAAARLGWDPALTLAARRT